MHRSDLNPELYPYSDWRFYHNDRCYLIAFNDLSNVKIFAQIEQGQDELLNPIGSIDCTQEVSDEFAIKVKERALELVKPSPTLVGLENLKTRIENCLTAAQELRGSESAATRDSEPRAVGRELSYAVVKLREARMWVNEAITIKQGKS
jgi:hypothetical protein